MAASPSYSTSNVPIPDPSEITAREIEKAKKELRQDYEDKIGSLKREMITRLDAMDKASVVLAENVNRVPTLLDREVLRVVDMLKRSEELSDEKFSGIGKQINERDIRTEQDKKSGETAITAAFQAQKEAAGKSEILFTKLIDNLQATLAANTKTTDDKISVINSRLAADDGGHRAISSGMTMAIAVGAIIVTLVIGVLTIIISSSSSSSSSSHTQPTVISPAVVPLNHPSQ